MNLLSNVAISPITEILSYGEYLGLTFPDDLKYAFLLE